MKSNVKVYRLTPKQKSPPTFAIATKSSRSKDLTWYDPKKKERREIRQCDNQKSIFVDEQDKNARLSHILFEKGVYTIHNEYPAKQEFMAHHPDNIANGGSYFYEVDHSKAAQAELDELEFNFLAEKTSRELGVEEMLAVMRKIKPDVVDIMEPTEIKRDLLLFASNNPKEFMRIANSIETTNSDMVERAIEAGIIRWKNNKTEVFRNFPDDKKMMLRAEPEQDPEEALTFYLMSKEGMEDFNMIEYLLNKD